MTPEERRELEEHLDALHTHVLKVVAGLLAIAVICNIIALWGF